MLPVTADNVSAFAHERLGPDNRAKLIYIPRAESESVTEHALEGSGLMTVATRPMPGPRANIIFPRFSRSKPAMVSTS